MSENRQPAVSPPDLVEAVQRATGEVFSTMLGLELETREAFVEKARGTAPASGVIALIGLAGAFAGTGSLSCSAEFACRMSGALLMSEHESMDEEVLDSIAEITNMVIGNVKTIIEEKLGVGLGLSTPTVIFGSNFQTRGTRNQDWIVIPFASGADSLFVQLCLAPNADPDVRPERLGLALPQIVTF